jgi:hypothetical protein
MESNHVQQSVGVCMARATRIGAANTLDMRAGTAESKWPEENRKNVLIAKQQTPMQPTIGQTCRATMLILMITHDSVVVVIGHATES